MPDIKPVDQIGAKWKSRAPQAQADYTAGVEGTKKDWAANTQAAVASYDSGVQASIQARRFEAGVAAAGTPKWRQRTLQKGPGRWVQGIQLSGDAYVQGFRPYAQVIASTSLPARGPRGSPQNYDRSRLMGQALNAARVG